MDPAPQTTPAPRPRRPAARAALLLGAVAAGLAAVAGLAFAAGRALEDDEPRYRGRTSFDWSEAWTNGPAATRAEALEVARSAIIPDLVRRIRSDTNDSAALLWAADALNSLPGLEVRRTPAAGRRNQAIHELALFGTNSAPAIPLLADLVRHDDEELCESAAGVLPLVGADASLVVPLLVPRLTNAAGQGRAEIVEAVALYGPAAKPALPVLRTLLADRSSKEIIHAVPAAIRAIEGR